MSYYLLLTTYHLLLTTYYSLLTYYLLLTTYYLLLTTYYLQLTTYNLLLSNDLLPPPIHIGSLCFAFSWCLPLGLTLSWQLWRKLRAENQLL